MPGATLDPTLSGLEPLHNDPLPWLLEEESPGVRYLALRDLLKPPVDSPELARARRAAHAHGPIATVLDAMQPEGYWEKPGHGYGPKYYSTVWALLLLAQLGASVQEDERVARACAYLIDHALLPGGQFSTTKTISGTVDCLQGNLCWALLALGCRDARLDGAFEWMARTVTGEGIAPAAEKTAAVRYYQSKCGPLFQCGANNKQACAWGGAKVMLAFGALPPERRTPLIERAIAQGIDFFLQTDPALALYPSGWTGKPSGDWWKFGFPVFYITDILQIVEAMAALGCGRDPRLAHALELVQSKQDARGRWPLEFSYTGKSWIDFGPKKAPNKWVTLRAVRALRAAAQ